MDLQPSKLSGMASRVWNESTGQFHHHKKADLKIDLGLKMEKTPSDAVKTTNVSEKASTSIASGYVFGSRMFERATKPEDNSTTKPSTTSTDNKIGDPKSDDGTIKNNSNSSTKPLDVSSIFRRIAEKNNTTTNGSNMWKTAVTSNGGSEESITDQLSKSASKLANMIDQQVVSNENEQQQITTGEEHEQHLLQISCKFYQYNMDTKEWQERGMGTLRLNQDIDSKENVRLVGRQSGSQRVLINSKVFPEMLLEEVSEKRVKISAHTGESDVPQLFLIQASPASIANLQELLQKYIDFSGTAKAWTSTTDTAESTRKRKLEEAVGAGENIEESDKKVKE